uniref:hypothetical protein n=1 Tax=Klebsormidium elegans TaxID=424407 RepID=UPI00286D3D62|nr:hypothetical protein RMD56_pgp002 [Klebsormidium elegans]WKT06712.1 hypothetical protein [Klebsormidium elegans]
MDEAKRLGIDLENLEKSIIKKDQVVIPFQRVIESLTDCELNPFGELRILEYAFQQYCTKYRGVNSSYLFTQTQIELFKEESLALAALLSGNWRQADARSTQMKNFALLFRENHYDWQTPKWSREWKNAWQISFDRLKKETALEIQSLSFSFSKEFPFYESLLVFSEAPSFLWEQNAEIYTHCSNNWRLYNDWNPSASSFSFDDVKQSALCDQSLILYYEKKNPEQSTYRTSFEAFKKSLNEPFSEGSEIVNKQEKIIVPTIYIAPPKNQIISDDRLKELQLQESNRELIMRIDSKGTLRISPTKKTKKIFPMKKSNYRGLSQPDSSIPRSKEPIDKD